MTISFKEKIGFLSYKEPILLDSVQIYPIENYNKNLAFIEEHSHRDGFYYPPLINTITQRYEVTNGQLTSKKEVVPNSSRPAHLFRLPASHYIEIDNPVCIDKTKTWDGLFLTYIVAFHFGIRLQFHDWRFDLKVPIKINRDFKPHHAETEGFISKAYEYWRAINDDGKKRLINLLYMQTRSKSYEWDWERFFILYMVLDGCYKYLNLYYNITSRSHKERIEAIIDHFDMYYNKTWIDTIVELRNDLFHETLWDSGQPCSNSSTYAWRSAFYLSRLNSRVIHAILGHNGEYIKSPWVSRSIFPF